MRTFGYACWSVFIALACATAAYAQPPQTPPGQAKKIKAPQQTPDRGDSDAARDLTPVEEAAVLQQFGKNEDGVTFTSLANGAVIAQVDDSYSEAITVTRGADGSLVFGHATGLQNAARAVKAGSATGRKTPAKKTPAPAPLEEKE